MKRLAVLAVLILSACAPSAQAIQTAIAQTQAARPISDELKTRLNKVLEDGSTLCAMTEQGVTFSDFGQQLATAKGDYTLALAMPSAEKVSPKTKTALDGAFTGWDLAYAVWDAKLNGGGAPIEMNQVLYQEIKNYAGLERLSYSSGTPGKGWLEKDQTISLLLTLASQDFKNGQTMLLAEME